MRTIELRELRMPYLIAGLLIFLGMHLLPSLASGWRQSWIAQHSERAWKGLFALVSIIGFALIVWGFAQARQQPVLLYAPPVWLRHVNELLTVLVFVLLAASRVPRNHLKAALGHPLIAAAKLWAFGHLLVNGMLHEVVLFGAFLLWAIIAFTTVRRRDRAAGVVYPAGTVRGDVLSVVIGIALWALFAFVLHAWFFGVAPFA